MRPFMFNFNSQKFFLIFLFLFGSVKFALSETNTDKSYALKKIIDCSNNPLLIECKNIILYTESLQLREYGKGNFRCQSSLLGAQTELIRNIYMNKGQNKLSKISTPFVTKNCKF